MEETDLTQDFSKWRRRLWPFHRSEIKKLLPLVLIKFLISLAYCILTNIKEGVVVTASVSGAEVIPVLKGWVVLPAAFIMAIVYSKLSHVLRKRTLFYTVLGGFLAAIFLYGFILYPNAEFFTPTVSSDWLLAKLGAKYSHWIAIYRNWIHSLLFLIAELWGAVVILLMFWSFANDVTNISEAKRSYNMYIAAGDIAAFSSGPIICLIIKKLHIFPYVFTLQALLALTILIGFLIMWIYWWVNKNVIDHLPMQKKKIEPKVKEKVSLLAGFKLIGKSPYLLGIAILVVGYGLCMTLIEVSWKANVKLLYPSAADYQLFTSKVMSSVGFIAFFISMFFGTNIIRRFGWRFSALISPILVGGTGILFFAALLFQNHLSFFTGLFGITPLVFIVFLGAFQNISGKVTKYSFFDPTKEMAYIPLSSKEKILGKAAIDVVGSRLGKSGASWIQIIFLDLFGSGSILSISHMLVPIIVLTTVSWIYSVNHLGKEFSKKTTTPTKTVKV